MKLGNPFTRRERLAFASPKASEAGARGKSAKPMEAADRVAAYQTQNERQCGSPRFTAAQRRRVAKKARAAYARDHA